MTNSTLIKTAVFAASRETVWAFLTEKDKLAEWFHPAVADLVEGGEFALTDENYSGTSDKICWGTVLEAERPSRLKYSFTVKPLGGAMTTVTWILEDIHGGTKLTLEHEGFDVAGDGAFSLMTSVDVGWDKHIGKLREMVHA